MNTQTSVQTLALPLAPDHTERAILRTVLYADIFDYPLTVGEIQHFLLGEAASEADVREALAQPWLGQYVVDRSGYYCLLDRTAIVTLRQERQAANARLWRTARRWGRWMNALPFARMVAVTGALAMDNAVTGDDIDFLIVTRPGRVWMTRVLAIVLVRVARMLGQRLCPNYVLSTTALAQSPPNVYIAHEIVQMVPLSGMSVYAQMRAANSWTHAWLPNAREALRTGAEALPSRGLRFLQWLGEAVLSGRAGDWLEVWEQRRKRRKFAREARQPHSAAQLDSEHVKGHFTDHGHRVLALFADRLARHGLTEEWGA